ncbi:MAG: hypothetical protein Q8P41_01635 [Pseudomonadota bacterium]|nr:hypothetical protein [Pseudomonadota bacterium]
MLPLLLLASLASAQDTPPAPPAAPPAPSDAPAAPPAEVLAVPAGAPGATDPAPVLVSYTPTVLFPIRAANLGIAEVRAAEVLFRRRYEVASGQVPFDEERVRAAITASDDKGLYAACQVLACTRWITIDLVRLDKEIFVTAIERDGAALVTQRIETVAASLDALPSTFDRLARALATRTPIEKIPAAQAPPASTASAPTTEPTTAPSKPARRGPVSLPGFKFGVLGALWPGFGLSLTHAFNWRLENKDKFFELSTGFTFPLELTADRTFGMVFAEVGLSHIFPSTGGTAFYAGGGFGPRIGGYDDTGIGVGVYGQGGVMFGRLSNTRAYLQLKLGGDAFTGYVEPYVISYAGMETGVAF